MKSGKIIALGLLALLPIAMKAQEAQEIEKLNARIDSLSQETTTLDKIVRKLSKFKVSAYIQGQFLQMEFINFLVGFVICEFWMQTIACQKMCIRPKQ